MSLLRYNYLKIFISSLFLIFSFILHTNGQGYSLLISVDKAQNCPGSTSVVSLTQNVGGATVTLYKSEFNGSTWGAWTAVTIARSCSSATACWWNIPLGAVNTKFYATAFPGYTVNSAEKVVTMYQPRLLLNSTDPGGATSNSNMNQNQTASFSLNLAGATNYSVTWYKNGVAQSLLTGNTNNVNFVGTSNQEWKAYVYNNTLGCGVFTNAITLKPNYYIAASLSKTQCCANENIQVRVNSFYLGTGSTSFTVYKSEYNGTTWGSWVSVATSATIAYNGSYYFWNLPIGTLNSKFYVQGNFSGGNTNSAEQVITIYQPKLLLNNNPVSSYTASDGEGLSLSTNILGATVSNISWFNNDAIINNYQNQSSPCPSCSLYLVNYALRSDLVVWKAKITNATLGCDAYTNEITIKPINHIRTSSSSNSYLTSGQTATINLLTYYGVSLNNLILLKSDYDKGIWSNYKVTNISPVNTSGNYSWSFPITNRSRFKLSSDLAGTLSSAAIEFKTINSIITYSPQIPIADESTVITSPVSNVNKSATYFDGLGRSIQSVQWQGSPTKKDIIQPTVYDAFGRETMKYLPIVPNVTDGGYKDGIIDASGNYTGVALNFYNNGTSDKIIDDPNPYAISKFEPSPLNRVIEQGAVGAAWQPVLGSTSSKTTKVSYLFNALNEVQIWTYNYNTFIASTVTTYDANILYKTQTTDENGNLSFEYKDKEDKVIYKKVLDRADNPATATIDESTFAETYYVYDDFGLLRVVIPPQAIKALRDAGSWTMTSAFQDLWCFQYKYDERQRIVEKKVPGAGWVYLVYDQRDRLILTQDANQRPINQWMFTKYDFLNRPVATGTLNVNYTKNQSDMQMAVYSYMRREEFFVNRENSLPIGYEDLSFPSTKHGTIEYLTVNYYDDYTFKTETQWTPSATTAYDFVAEQGVTWSATLLNKGRVTGTKVKVLGETTWLKTVSYYDDKGRMIQNIADNYVSSSSLGQDRTTLALDFTGKVTAKQLSHTGIETVTTKETYSYDHADRLLDVYHGVAAGTTAPTTLTHLSNNTYNELGQLVDKKLGVTDGATPTNLQSVDYRYNIRGWLRSINNASLTNDGTVSNDDANDLWGMELKYNDPVTGGTAQFNGNISEMVWGRRNFQNLAIIENPWGNQYTYDPLNRLTSNKSTRRTAGTWAFDSKYDEAFSYDKNGNILTLTRQGVPTIGSTPTISQIDNMAYTYNGNQLLTLVDNAPVASKDFSFKDVVMANGIDYTYDANGNMLTDANSGTSITYNILSLPQTTTKGTVTATYKYDATGRKLYKTSSLGTTYYMGAFQFERNSTNTEALYFLNTAEGRVVKTTLGQWNGYEYFLKDHLGNVRMSFDKNGSGGTLQIIQTDVYYSFGSPIVDGTMSKLITRKNNFLYNGKEKQEENGYYDYGARFYDANVGRWFNVDPLAEKYLFSSSYNYCLNNPSNAVDPDGKRVFFVAGAGNDKIGWNYTEKWQTAFNQGGIRGFTRLDASHGTLGDILFTSNFRESRYNNLQVDGYPGMTIQQEKTDEQIDNAVGQIKSNLKKSPLSEGEQLNLLGYSYGSVLQAHAALELADQGFKIDNLILVGSPISKNSDLYKQLVSHKNIGQVLRIDIENDKLSNPKDILDFIKGGIQNRDSKNKGEGPHFDLARPGTGNGNQNDTYKRLQQVVVEWLKQQGVK